MAGNKRSHTDIRKEPPPEPDLQEHQRLIKRALTQNGARELARSAQNALTTWVVVLVIGAAVLCIAAVAALSIATVFLR